MSDLAMRVRRAVAAESAREVRAQEVADTVRSATGHRWVGVYAVEPSEVVNLAWSGPGPPRHTRFPVVAGLTAAAIQARTTIVSNDVAADPRYLTALETTGSEIIVPVFVEGQVVGTLDVESEAVGAFGEEDCETLERVAAELGPLYR